MHETFRITEVTTGETRDVPMPAPCCNGHDDYVCTLARGHRGDHVANDGERDCTTWSNTAGYTAPAPVLPMPDTVTYRCHDCGAEISHRDPFEAHALYVDHMDTHDPGADPEPLTDAEVAELEDRAARYAEHPVVYPLEPVDPEGTD